MRKLLALLLIALLWAGTGNAGRFQVNNVPAVVTTLTATGAVSFEAQFTLNLADPAILFDGSTASDTDFWMGVTADEGGDDNDFFQIGKGTTIGTTPFFTWDSVGGFIAQNLTDAVTGYVFGDSDGGTGVLIIDTVNEWLGISTTATHKLTILDASNPQLSLEHTAGSVRTLFQTNVNGGMVITPSGGQVLLPLGSNAAPTFSFADDSNTGMYRPASGDTLGFAMGGIQRAQMGANYVRVSGGGTVSTPGFSSLTDTNTGLHIAGADTLGLATNGTDGLIVDSNQGVTIAGAGTKHDGYVVRSAAELQTLDATADQVLDNITLLDENTYHVEAWVVAVQSDGTDRASYHIAATVFRTGAGAATLQGTVTSLHTQESNAALDCTFTVNSNDVRVAVTGIAAETWEFGCTMKFINMSN